MEGSLIPDMLFSLLRSSSFLRVIYNQYLRPQYLDGKHNILSSIDTI